jgi:hypothetical protein
MTRSRIPARWLALALGLLLLSACGQKSGEPTNSGNAPNRDGGTPVVRGPADFKTTADAITKEVIADQKAAEKKYNGKVVEVEGEVSTANKIINPNGFSMKGAKAKPTDAVGVVVICTVPKGAEGKAWRLSSGQRVKLVGTAAVGHAVYLNDCTVEPLEPATTAKVTAKGLAEEVVKDADAARKKYQTPEGYPKEIIVEGVVAALEKTKDGFHIVKLAGAGGLTVNCTVDEKDFAALKTGDAVTIKGDFSNYYPEDKGVTVNTAFVLPKE